MAAEDDSYYNSQQDSQHASQQDSNYPSQSDGAHTSQTDSSNQSSDRPRENIDPLTELIPVRNYLSLRDYERFKWDDEGRETSHKWLSPVHDVGLDQSKHKVFHHGNRDYLPPGHPFKVEGWRGQSGSNMVFKVTSPPAQNYRRPLALKVILCTDKSRTPGPRSKARRLALEEVKNMSAIRHSHIVVYVASYEDYSITTTRIRHTNKKGEKVWRVQEEIDRHILGIAMYPPAKYNLLDLMEKKRGNRRDLRHMHSYFGCLAQAVSYLHKSDVQIRHKDIKPANIVIDENNIPLLTDFGLSKHFEVGKESDGPTAKTLKYAEPEAVRETSRNERSDIFPLGCVFLEMATVLLGLPPSFPEQRLKTPGSRDDFKYCESLGKLQAYLSELEEIAQDLMRSDPGKERSARCIVEILPVIARMMDEQITGRPFAKELYPRFRHLYDAYPGSPGPCRSCEEEVATDRSFPLTPTPSMLVTNQMPRTRSSTGQSSSQVSGSTSGNASRSGTMNSRRTTGSGGAGGESNNSNRNSLVFRTNSSGLTGSPTELTMMRNGK